MILKLKKLYKEEEKGKAENAEYISQLKEDIDELND